jgi:tRNA-specific 2-thiouridylase
VPTPAPILVAMSGGVDSSVAALRLKQQGLPIVGAYMKNWINEDKLVGDCPWQRDIEDARAVCDQLGIDFQVINLMRDYRERVVAYLLDGYARGLTPNPDIMCNREIKFGVFRTWAKENGFSAVATGHYAQRAEASLADARAPATRTSPTFSRCFRRSSCATRVFPLAIWKNRHSASSRARLACRPRIKKTARASASSGK